MKTHAVANQGDQLLTTFYPNAGQETVMLLHGGPGFPDDLEMIADTLKDRFQVITFHQRGTRKSPCPSGDYSMQAYLSDIETVRNFYGIDRFHLWGHSWGGLYAQIYADRYPAHLLSLFLCSPGSGTHTQWKQTEKEVMQLNRSKSTAWQWSKMGINNLLGMLGSDTAYQRLFKQVMQHYHAGFIDYTASDDFFDNLKAAPINKTRREIIRHPLLARQENPGFKITLVYGDHDIYGASRHFVIDRYPTASVATISNCGHIPWLHNPEQYRAISSAHYQSALQCTLMPDAFRRHDVDPPAAADQDGTL